MQRSFKLIVLGVAVALFAGASIGIIRTPRFQKWYYPPVMVLPADEEVAEVRASLRASQHGFEAVPEFVVPAEHVTNILGWLRPAEYIPEPWRLNMADELGEVVILTRSGRELRLRFYSNGKNPATFTANGEDKFFGNAKGDPCDGGIQLGIAIEEAKKACER